MRIFHPLFRGILFEKNYFKKSGLLRESLPDGDGCPEKDLVALKEDKVPNSQDCRLRQTVAKQG